MPRFHLHLFNSTGYVPDDEGHELAGISEAREHAIRSIRDLLSEEVKQGQIDLNGRVEIVGSDGRTLEVVRFADAIRGVPPQ